MSDGHFGRGMPDDDADLHARLGREQTESDSDQTFADADQGSSDADRAASSRDQFASDRDQAASDRDQAAADRDQEAAEHPGEWNLQSYGVSRRLRSRSALERDISSQARAQNAEQRDQAATERDLAAAERDAAARRRDAAAARLDAEIERLVKDGFQGNAADSEQVARRARAVRDWVSRSRARAAENREAAAADRAMAARDRRLAARDRAAASEEIALSAIDHLTGALRRGAGLAAIQRELDRTQRSGESLTIAFVDVEGLKAINDSRGPAAGDAALREVASCISGQLRSYDVVARYGGDEFLCSLSGQDDAGARARFESISEHLASVHEAPRISVGLAERRAVDTLDELIGRADRAMLDSRRRLED